MAGGNPQINAGVAYWKWQLAGSPLALALPTDRPRPAMQSFLEASQRFILSAELSAGLRELSRQEGVTLFMTLLAALQTLLHRYTGQDDIVVGSPGAHRNRTELKGLLGLFVNTVALRTDLSGNPTFRELLRRVREVVLGAYAHQDLPFAKLVEEWQPERERRRNPLFQVLFALQNTPMRALELSGLTLNPLEVDTGTAEFDMALSMVDREQELMGALAYNSHLFDAATITWMLGHFQTVLEGIVAHPEQRLSTLPLLTASERHRLLVEWNNTTADDSQDQRIHELFEAQVERTPEAIAVVCEDGQLTYRELNTRANQLAHYLRMLGVGPDVLVGLCMERSLEMVVGLLGILKAGGAYVPLDPAYPKERLAFMMADAQIPVLLTQGRLVEGLPKHGAHMVCLDTDWEVIAREGKDTPISSVTAENLAYVIYTSGSTGQPKGVLISHGAIVNHMRWMQAAFPLSEADCVVQKTPVSFDASVWEFLAPLIAGARLLMARPGGHQDSAYLVKLLAEQQVTVLQLVPSTLQVLLEEEGLEACTALRRVFCGGEALPVRLQERFFARLNASLYNLYGPTEATIDATCWSCTRERDQRLVPIGRPITHTQAYILDPHLSLCLSAFLGSCISAERGSPGAISVAPN